MFSTTHFGLVLFETRFFKRPFAHTTLNQINVRVRASVRYQNSLSLFPRLIFRLCSGFQKQSPAGCWPLEELCCVALRPPFAGLSQLSLEVLCVAMHSFVKFWGYPKPTGPTLRLPKQPW